MERGHVASCVSLVSIPLFGDMSDRIGRRKIYLIGARTALKIRLRDARAYGKPLISLGHYPLRGLAKPHELFAPAIGSPATGILQSSGRVGFTPSS